MYLPHQLICVTNTWTDNPVFSLLKVNLIYLNVKSLVNLFTSVYRPLIESQELRKKKLSVALFSCSQNELRRKEPLGQSFTSVERPCNSSRIQTLRLYIASNVTFTRFNIALLCLKRRSPIMLVRFCCFLAGGGVTTRIHSRGHIGPKIHSKIQTLDTCTLHGE